MGPIPPEMLGSLLQDLRMPETLGIEYGKVLLLTYDPLCVSGIKTQVTVFKGALHHPFVGTY